MMLEMFHRDQKTTVEISSQGGSEKILLNGEEVECDWVRLRDGHYSIIIQGRVYDVNAEISGEMCSIAGSAADFNLRIVDQRHPVGTKPIEGGRAGLRRIVAEMPGKVIRILVGRGEKVTHDQGLLVLEAMKMQNEIRAPKSGVIRAIGVTEGKAVNSGDFLLSLE